MRTLVAIVTVSSMALAVGVPRASLAALQGEAAQTDAEPPSEAVDAFYRGRELFDEGRYEEALVHFERADKLHPSADLQYNIGQCHMRLGHWQPAMTAFEVYLHLQPDARDRGHVEKLIEEARSNLSEPQGKSSPSTMDTIPLIQRPGPVEETVTAREREAQKAADVEAGLHRVSVPEPVARPPHPTVTTQSSEPPQDDKTRNARALIGTGATALTLGLGGIGAGVALTLMVRDRNEVIRRINEGNPEGVSLTEAAELQAENDRMALGQYIAYGAGGALTVTGIVLTAVGAKRKQQQNDRAGVASVEPIRLRQGGGLRLMGRF